MSLDARYSLVPISTLKPAKRNARTHSSTQIEQIAASIRRYGLNKAFVVDTENNIVAGNGTYAAAVKAGIKEVVIIRLSSLSKDELRAYALDDNQLGLKSGWDGETLAEEIKALLDVGVLPLGFDEIEIEGILTAANDASPDGEDDSAIDEVVEPSGPIVSQLGDLWELGRHRLLCGDAQSLEQVTTLMGGEKANMVFTDAPYNREQKAIGNNGKHQHEDFAFASGEMSRDEFTAFLTTCFKNIAANCRDGAIVYLCMDWRHLMECQSAGDAAFTELKNLCVWNKRNGGMGTFYRSKHELIFVYKSGTAPHTNNFGLGERGRHRTNVWEYPGVNAFRAGRDEDLAAHPTVKPVAMIVDAIRDVTKRKEIILDVFGGSGTTLLAAQQTGRSARLLEYEGKYCDVTIRRWQKLTGKSATLVSSGKSFDEVKAERTGWTSHVA